jgi:hypothetical protein
MKYLKTYKTILEDFDKHVAYQHQYSIVDFSNDLKSERDFRENVLKMWVDHFIGKDYYDKIVNFVDNINSKLEKIDLMDIEDRLFYVFDQYNVENSIQKVIFTSTHFNTDIIKGHVKNDKNYLIRTIILGIIIPTLDLRSTKDELYVLDKKWQCANIDPKLSSGYENPFSELKTIGRSFRSKKWLGKYSADNFLDMYKPGIKITLGCEYGSSPAIINFLKTKDLFNEVLPDIINDLTYLGLNSYLVFPEDGVWLSDSTRVSSFSIKIIIE